MLIVRKCERQNIIWQNIKPMSLEGAVESERDALLCQARYDAIL